METMRERLKQLMPEIEAKSEVRFQQNITRFRRRTIVYKRCSRVDSNRRTCIFILFD